MISQIIFKILKTYLGKHKIFFDPLENDLGKTLDTQFYIEI